MCKYSIPNMVHFGTPLLTHACTETTETEVKTRTLKLFFFFWQERNNRIRVHFYEVRESHLQKVNEICILSVLITDL